VVLEANPAYWGRKPAYKTVVLKYIKDPTALNNALYSNGIDVISAITAPDSIPQFQADDRFQVVQGTTNSEVTLAMNNARPPLNDVRVRQALLFARDSAAINRLLYDGTYIASDGPLDNVHPCFWNGVTAMYPPNPDRARQLLDEAGWRVVQGQPIRQARGVAGVADGTPLRVRWTVLHHRPIGEAVQQQLRRVGVDLVVEVVPGPVQLDRVNRRDFDLMYERQRSPDPVILDQIWNSRWDQPGGWAWTGFRNEELDRTVGQLRTLSNQDARCEAARQAQRIIMENALVFPTLSQPVLLAFSPRVQNFKMGAEGNWFYLHSTWLSN